METQKKWHILEGKVNAVNQAVHEFSGAQHLFPSNRGGPHHDVYSKNYWCHVL